MSWCVLASHAHLFGTQIARHPLRLGDLGGRHEGGNKARRFLTDISRVEASDAPEAAKLTHI